MSSCRSSAEAVRRCSSPTRLEFLPNRARKGTVTGVPRFEPVSDGFTPAFVDNRTDIDPESNRLYGCRGNRLSRECCPFHFGVELSVDKQRKVAYEATLRHDHPMKVLSRSETAQVRYTIRKLEMEVFSEARRALERIRDAGAQKRTDAASIRDEQDKVLNDVKIALGEKSMASLQALARADAVLANRRTTVSFTPRSSRALGIGIHIDILSAWRRAS